MAFDYDLYFKLDYIQSSGSNYINTGIAPGNTTYRNLMRIEADMQYVTTPSGSSSQYLFGAGYYNQTASNRRTIAVGYRQDSSTSKVAYLNGAQLTTIVVHDGSTLDANRHIYGIDQVNRNYIFDDSLQSFTTTISSNLTSTLKIFCGQNSSSSGQPISYYATAKCYGFKVYVNGTLHMDLVPALRKDGTVGMYDVVDESFYTASGTGDFTYGKIEGRGAIYLKVNGAWVKGVSYIKQNGEWR